MEFDKEFYTSKEVMKIFNVKDYRTLRKWERMGNLVPIKSPTGKYMYPKKEMERYIELCKK